MADSHFAPDRRIACQFIDVSVGNGLGGQPVGDLGVDADQGGWHLDQLPCVFEFASGVVVHGQVDWPAGLAAGAHATRVGTMRGNGFAVGQANVGQKAFVALDERAGNQIRPTESVVRGWCVTGVGHRRLSCRDKAASVVTGEQIQNLGFCIQPPPADPRARSAGFLPAGLAAQVGEPEREGSALSGAYRVDATTGLEKEATTVRSLPDAVPTFPRGQMAAF
ncbi:hypothetical protein DESC_780013 [Desulfosarcina cetonica]|nr:hypothetical protein DESC_780013 [Desulfosarcina cetonica]